MGWLHLDIPFSLLWYLLFCCWCWQGADSLCSFVFICAAKDPMRCSRWQHLNNPRPLQDWKNVESCLTLSDICFYWKVVLWITSPCHSACEYFPQSKWIYFSNFLFYSISVSCLGRSDLSWARVLRRNLDFLTAERLLRKITRNPGRHLHNGVISWILAKPAPNILSPHHCS